MKIYFCFILFLFNCIIGICQHKKLRQIDSLCEIIRKTEYYYWYESPGLIKEGDSIKSADSIAKFRYTEKRKDLIYVDVWNFKIDDSSAIEYFFNNRKLIKVIVYDRENGKPIQSSFYYHNEVMIYPESIADDKMKKRHFINSARKYLLFKPKLFTYSAIQ